ncbi:glycine cleavage system aminomethyltransferase GcvT [Microcella humidisoli]|uniref:Aminomethyltransferase n=1 Tax=Microcella humidisoli TaxID=2963406 RepID=A0ABY5FX23_9MICO|nr:glycine cleavage system aminomethyltransferase GcvT [Microcella humidisoli]UTT62862.1 glycine cleavage system aminomethyltransferase GcvT [Microcella humidisoli]
MSESIAPQRHSPLHAVHEALGAAFTDFAGWQMPVRYSSDLAEHHAVRTAAGIFDISHMAEIAVDGPDAAAFLDAALAGRLSAMAPGKAKYSLVLDEHGGIVDDLIVYRMGDTSYLVVANASNRFAVVDALRERAAGVGGPAFAVEIDDRTEQIALIAVQGPASAAVLAATAGLTIEGLEALKYYAWGSGSFAGTDLMVARTGYTGEDGFELYAPVEHAAALWAALTAAGEPLGLVPCGLAARDTLRLEAGMPLYGHELGLSIQPVQAGLGRVVVTDKPAFVGRDAILAGPPEGAPVLVGLRAEGRRAARAEYPVFHGETLVGGVTSGALSPTLGYPIAMAFVSPEASALGTALELDVRGTRIPATVVALPFYSRS